MNQPVHKSIAQRIKGTEHRAQETDGWDGCYGMVSDIHSTMNLPNTTQTHKHGLKVCDYSVWLLALETGGW